MKHVITISKRFLILTLLMCSTFYFSYGGLFQPKLPDKSFTVSSKSKKIHLNKGESYFIKINMKAMRYYYFSIVANKKAGNIHYKITDPADNNEVLFDNAAYEFKKNSLFYNEYEREVVIEIKIMPGILDFNSEKENSLNLVFANKKSNNREDYHFNTEYPLYALN